MIVIDTSAVIAILRLEAEADAFLRAIARAESCFISAVSALETAMVLAGAAGIERIRLVFVDDAGDAFHVDGDVDAHRGASGLRGTVNR